MRAEWDFGICLPYIKGLNSWSTCIGGQYELHIWDFLGGEIYLVAKVS